MDAFSSYIAAELQEDEVDLLRSVFGRLCTEYNIATQGKQTEHLARFLLRELRSGVRDEDSLLEAARLFHGE
jgi:hypothetical protein